MKKHTVFLLAICSILLCSCPLAAHLQSYEYETVTFTLPNWPAALPELQGWTITGNSGTDENREQSLSLPPDAKSFTLHLKKNEPFYVCASPLTCSNGFFKCAGTIYPYSKAVTWSGGYAAVTMKTLKAASGQSYLLRFNWERFINVLEQKQQNQTVTYNPWLLDSSEVLQSIAYHNFTAAKLNTSGTLAIELDFPVFSSYVPENQVQSTEKQTQINIKKGIPQLFMLNDNTCKTGVIICGTSLKNLSMDFISMPIFTEGI